MRLARLSTPSLCIRALVRVADPLNRLRRLAAESRFRQGLLHPLVRRTGASLLSLRFLPAAWAVTHPITFLLREQRHRGTHAYHLRGGRGHVVIRHDKGGLELLHEVFRRGCYMPEPEFMPAFPEEPRLLDLGANVGAFAAFALAQWPKARLTCVEPDPENLDALMDFCSFHPAARIAVVEACATNKDGFEGFMSGLGAGSRMVEGAPLIRAIDALPLMADADFVKMDIEGSEWSILRDPRLASLGQLLMVLEYHRRFPHDTKAAAEAESLLHMAGFRVTGVEPNYWGHGLMWAVKP